MGRAWLLSFAAHAALAVVLYFGLPTFTGLPPAIRQAVTVELVTEVPEPDPGAPAGAPAEAAPLPERAAASPEPEPVPEEPEPEPEPEPAPEPEPEPAPEPVSEPEPEPEPPAPAPAAEEAPPEPEPLPEPEPEEVAALPPEEPLPPEPAPKPEPQVQPPAQRPELKPERPQPAPQVKPREPEPDAKPQEEPEKEEEDAFAALLRSVEQLEQRVESETEREGSGRNWLEDFAAEVQNGTGEATLSAGEVSALKRQIAGCWRLPIGAEGIEDMVVQLRIQVRPDGTVQQVTIEDQARLERDPIFRVVAESARRAVDNCSPLLLPAGKYALWRDMLLNFRPEDAIRS